MSQTSNSRTLTPQNTPFKSSYQQTPRLQISFPSQGKTKQSFKDECDVNKIMARYYATGELPNLNAMPPQFLDVTFVDFQEHQNFIAEANSMFHSLPSAIRTRFENSPALFLDFCSHEKNRPELAEMGLLREISPPVVPYPQPTQTNSTTAPETGSPVSS